MDGFLHNTSRINILNNRKVDQAAKATGYYKWIDRCGINGWVPYDSFVQLAATDGPIGRSIVNITISHEADVHTCLLHAVEGNLTSFINTSSG